MVNDMGELRTLLLYVAGPAGTPTWVDHLFEKTTRIKKIVLVVNGTGTTDGMVIGMVTKHKVEPINEGIGHMALVVMRQNVLTQGMSIATRIEVVDLGDDYFEIEEDGFLYVLCSATTMAGTVHALIYYEE